MHFVDAFETGVSETTSSLAEKYNPCRIIRRKNEKKNMNFTAIRMDEFARC